MLGMEMRGGWNALLVQVVLGRSRSVLVGDADEQLEAVGQC